MNNYPNIASRVFNRPHLVEPRYGRVFISALAERLDIRSMLLPDGSELDRNGMERVAQTFGPERQHKVFEEVDGIAVIPILGTLAHRYGHLNPFSGMTGYDGIQTKLDAALEDPSIRGILLDIDSPGGEVSGCFDLTDYIYEARRDKPIWALTDELACSAAFSLASACTRIVAPRTAQIGSVGVLTAHVDHSQMLEGAGLDVTLIFAGQHKVDGNPYEPLPEAVQADIQAEIDELYGMFTNTVARNRGMREQAVRDTEARVYSGREAIGAGFADEILAAREILTAFDDYLRGQRNSTITMEVPRMDILGKIKSAAGKASPKARRAALQRLEEEAAAEDPETATDDDAGNEDAAADQASDTGAHDAAADPADEAEAAGTEDDAGDDPETVEAEDEAQAAGADRIVEMCAEAGCDRLARPLIREGATVATARARLDNARCIRDAFAAAGFEHLAGDAIDSGMTADFARSLLTEVTAAAAGEEVDPHQPTGQAAPKATINAVEFYSRQNAAK